MDDIDLAQNNNEILLDSAIRAARGIVPTGTLSEYCDERIPEARRAANPDCTRCVECQENCESR